MVRANALTIHQIKEVGLLIEFQNVTKSYSHQKIAVDNLSMRIHNGEIFGFLGPNGAGKSTTIKMMTGILPVDKGEIILNGMNIAKEPLQAKKIFGYVPDSPNMFLRLKGIEYLHFIGDIYEVPAKVREEVITKLADDFEITHALQDQIQTYSHGMRQKIIIIGALLHQPDIWILDEPLTGLDPKSAHKVKEIMREYADSGKIVFFSTHVLEVAEKICDRVGIIDSGQIQFCGNIDEMRQHFATDSTLEQMFLEITDHE